MSKKVNKHTGLTKAEAKAVRKGKAEIKRTCQRCGRTWFTNNPMGALPDFVVYAPGALDRSAAGAQRVRSAQVLQEQAREARSCPDCGSSSFEQEVVPV